MMNPEQIKGQIADIESKIQTLSQGHDKMVAQFNQNVASNQAAFFQLNGQLTAYRQMLEKPKKEKKKK